MNDFTYDEVQRERLVALFGSVIQELAWQDEIAMYCDKELKRKCNYKETAELFIDKLNCMENEEFSEFKKKLIELIYDF